MPNHTLILTPLQAAYNIALYTEHVKEAEKPLQQKQELYFGVYRSRKFVRITRSTPWLERLKCYIQWLFGLISYKSEDVIQLAILSRKHWVPATEKTQLENAIDAKIKQLEAAQNLLTEAQQNVELLKASLHSTEQMLHFHEQLVQQKEDTFQKSQANLSSNQQLYAALKAKIDQKDKEYLQKFQECGDLQIKLQKVESNFNIMDKTFSTKYTLLLAEKKGLEERLKNLTATPKAPSS